MRLVPLKHDALQVHHCKQNYKDHLLRSHVGGKVDQLLQQIGVIKYADEFEYLKKLVY